MRQVWQKPWQVAAHGAASHGKSVVFSGYFPENSTTATHKTSCLRTFQGCGARKRRPTAGWTAPTALRPRPTCLPCQSGICNVFLPLCVSTARLLLLHTPPPHPRSWPAMGHEKARAMKPWPTLICACQTTSQSVMLNSSRANLCMPVMIRSACFRRGTARRLR